MVEPEEPNFAKAIKSGGRDFEEENDVLDKILAEQGERTSTSKPSAPLPHEEKPS